MAGSRSIRGPMILTDVANVTTASHQIVNASVVNVNFAGAVTITLPQMPPTTAVGAGEERIIFIKDISGAAQANNITINVFAASGNLIDGASSIVINTNYGTVILGWNGVGWSIISWDTVTSGGAVVAASGVIEGAAGAAGAAGVAQRIQKILGPLADNTTGTLFTITVPNVLAGAAVRVTVTGSLGDGDSTDSAIYMIGVSRIAGANAKAVASTKSVVGATAGATANAVVTVAVPAVTGAVGATNTFLITAKVARSAGTSANHIVTAEVEVLNSFAGGVTVS